jgi:ankyrin repeat protein
MLIKSGAAIHIYSHDKRTALHLACEEGFLEIVTLLLDSGAHPIPPIEDAFESPLHRACKIGYPDIVSLLLQRGMDVNDRNFVRFPFEASISLTRALSFSVSVSLSLSVSVSLFLSLL